MMTGAFDEAMLQVQRMKVRKVKVGNQPRPVAQSSYPFGSTSHCRAQNYVGRLQKDFGIVNGEQIVGVRFSTIATIIENAIKIERHNAKVDIVKSICQNVAAGRYGKDVPEKYLSGLADDIAAEIEGVEPD